VGLGTKELGSLKVVCVEACWCVRLLAAAAIERQLKCLSDDSAKGGMRTSSAQHLLRQHGTAPGGCSPTNQPRRRRRNMCRVDERDF
jgi:hypothetical protein